MRDNAATVGKSFRFLPAPTCSTGNATPEDKVRGGWREVECCRPSPGRRCRGESTDDNDLLQLLCSLSIAAHSVAEKSNMTLMPLIQAWSICCVMRAPRWQVVQEKLQSAVIYLLEAGGFCLCHVSRSPHRSQIGRGLKRGTLKLSSRVSQSNQSWHSATAAVDQENKLTVRCHFAGYLYVMNGRCLRRVLTADHLCV